MRRVPPFKTVIHTGLFVLCSGLSGHMLLARVLVFSFYIELKETKNNYFCDINFLHNCFSFPHVCYVVTNEREGTVEAILLLQ